MPSRAAFAVGRSVTLEQLERDPHPVFATLREREPVSWVDALGGWLVTRYDLALAVMRDPITYTVQDERFSTARVLGPSMLSLDGEEHRRHRTPFVAPLRPRAVRERFAAAVEAQCERLVDGLAPAGRCELRTEFAAPLAAGVLAEALGLGPGAAPALVDAYRSIVAAVTTLTAGGPLAPAAVEAYAELSSRLSQTLAAGAPSSLLVAAARAADGTLDERELIANAAVLLFGGIETTEGMITSAFLHVLREPGLAERITAEPGVLERALDESLRLEPAAAMVDRYATIDTVLDGVEIAAGELVHVSLAAAGRDPAVFDDPDRLDLERPQPSRHLAFAQGPHVCVGVHLARLEARTALARLLARLPALGLDPSRPAEVRGLVFRKPPELWVRWSAAEPGSR